MAAARRRLVHLQTIGERTRSAEQRILVAARHRLGVVRDDIARLLPRVDLDDAAAETYTSRVAESGQLAVVIASAQAAIG